METTLRWHPWDIAWVAGILEGEGWFGLNRMKGRTYPHIAAHMTDEDVIRRLHSVLEIGTVTGPHPSQNGMKPTWRWRVQSKKDAARLLLALYPLLSTRRRAQVSLMVDSLTYVRADKIAKVN